MYNLLGFFLIITGDVFLVTYLSYQKKRQLSCLAEMVVFLREVTCLVYEFKMPIEDALREKSEIGEFSHYLWQEVTKNTHKKFRQALSDAIKQLPLGENWTAKIITQYFGNLGKSPKEPAMEHYKTLQKQLAEIIAQKKEETKKNTRLFAGGVYGISLMLSILLW